MNTETNNERWERETLREVLLEHIREQRRARRWKLGTRLALVAAVVFLAVSLPTCRFGHTVDEIGPHTAQVRLEGPIMADSSAGSDIVIQGLNAAFRAPDAEAIVLRINSPGGSPVHSSQIHHEIKRLRKEHPETALYAVIEDIGASGAYYVAAAADEIYVDRASLVGSIGVIMGGFGLQDAMERLGIERRVYTAGDNKAFLDPFSPENPRHVDHLRAMLDEIHEQFIEAVLEGRGERLDETRTDELFSGLVWTGEQGVTLGLVDGIGDIRTVARDVVGAEEIVDYTAERDFLSVLADRLGAAAGRAVHSALTYPAP